MKKKLGSKKKKTKKKSSGDGDDEEEGSSSAGKTPAERERTIEMRREAMTLDSVLVAMFPDPAEKEAVVAAIDDHKETISSTFNYFVNKRGKSVLNSFSFQLLGKICKLEELGLTTATLEREFYDITLRTKPEDEPPDSYVMMLEVDQRKDPFRDAFQMSKNMLIEACLK